MKQTPGRIYLADQRGLTENPQFRRYSTFNFGDFYNEHKMPLGNLYVVNEETLAGLQTIALTVEQASHVIIMPVTGMVNFTNPQGQMSAVDVGEIQINHLPANSTFRITNPYPANSISFLQIWMKAEQVVDTVSAQLFSFSFDAMDNKLAEIITADKANTKLPFSLHLGRLAGRHETVYKLKHKDALFFAFVIVGAFELEGRLLHEKDGLALWDTNEVELEALSNNAIVLVLELEKAAGYTS